MKFNVFKVGDRGTTIVEALVVIIILSLGLVPSLSIIIFANNTSASIINDLIAANLAQEGIEVVRAVRDANWFANPPRPFDTGLSAGTYRVEWDSTSLISETGSNPPLKLDSNGLYNYTTCSDTNFRRRIIIVKDPTLAGCNCELRVVSEVTWLERGRTKIITVESHLFDWK